MTHDRTILNNLLDLLLALFTQPEQLNNPLALNKLQVFFKRSMNLVKSC